MEFEMALAHTMISWGSVVKSDVDESRWNHSRFGSYYHSCIEADPVATEAFFDRLLAGAKPIYEKCHSADFGMEHRFNGTFASRDYEIKYAKYTIRLDDRPDEDIELVAQVEIDLNASFLKTLELLSKQASLDWDEVVEILADRVRNHNRLVSEYNYADWGPLAHPNLFRKQGSF